MLVKGCMYHSPVWVTINLGPGDPKTRRPKVLRSVLQCIDCSYMLWQKCSYRQSVPMQTQTHGYVLHCRPKTLFTADSATSQYCLSSEYPALLPLVSQTHRRKGGERVQLHKTRSQFAQPMTLGPLYGASI